MIDPDADVVLAVSHLTVRHGGVVALDDVSLSIRRGEIAGLIGPNGAGKTTFIDALSGFSAPSSGTVELLGVDLGPLAPHERARSGLARTFQSLELFDDLTVRENVAVAAAPTRRWDLVRDLLRRRPTADDRVDEVLERLDLTAVASRRPDALSNGRRHMVALARAVVGGPDVVLLDEPAAGLDTTETTALAGLLGQLPELGISVLLVDHDMAVVLGVCDTVHVLDFGTLVTSGAPAEVRADQRVISAYLGTEGPTR